MQGPSSKIELNVSCRFSDSDPCVVVEEKINSSWTELGRTEIIQNQCNPSFKKSFLINYNFEQIQPFRFRVFDWDDENTTLLDRQEFIGQLVKSQLKKNNLNKECNLSEIVGSRGQFKRAELVNPNKPKRKNGFIIVTAEEVQQPTQYNDFTPLSTIVPNSGSIEDMLAAVDLQLKETSKQTVRIEKDLSFKCSAKNLDKKDFFGKSDPYFKIYRTREVEEAPVVFESKVVMKTLDPTWKEARVPLQKMCNSDLDRPLRFEVWDWDRHSSHDLIGEFSTSLRAVIDGQKEHKVIHPKKTSKKGYEHSGIFVFNQIELKDRQEMSPNPAYASLENHRNELMQQVIQSKSHYNRIYNPYSFVQYLAGGCEISLMVAIDFTESNGDADKPHSLHYYGGIIPSNYAQAISAVGGILADYDSDKKFPVFGFGGRTKTGIRHCFPLNGNDDDPECVGVDGILQAYDSSVRLVPQGYPTNFAEVIAKAQSYASAYVTQQNQKYFLLLIITDGDITDKKPTISQLVQASSLPLSVVIVGVGNNSFAAMDMLDADDSPLYDELTGQHSVRDIVQFVPFNQFKHDPAKLAEETLAEIPRQVTEFMSSRQIRPNPKIVINDNFVYGESVYYEQ